MQQLFLFTNLFKSALHVSGDKFAHPQEYFLTAYTAFGTMHRHCCRPVSGLYQKLYIQSKSAPEDGRICRQKHVGLIYKDIKRKSCCILLVTYVVILAMQSHTNVKDKGNSSRLNRRCRKGALIQKLGLSHCQGICCGVSIADTKRHQHNDRRNDHIDTMSRTVYFQSGHTYPKTISFRLLDIVAILPIYYVSF